MTTARDKTSCKLLLTVNISLLYLSKNFLREIMTLKLINTLKYHLSPVNQYARY